MTKLKWNFCQKYGGRENLMCCNVGEHMQLQEAPASWETIFDSLTAHVLQFLTTQTT